MDAIANCLDQTILGEDDNQSLTALPAGEEKPLEDEDQEAKLNPARIAESQKAEKQKAGKQRKREPSTPSVLLAPVGPSRMSKKQKLGVKPRGPSGLEGA